MYLTAVFKLRANNHDRHRIETARRRWTAALKGALERSRQRKSELLRCIVMYDGKRGKRLVVDGRKVHTLAKECVLGYPTGLHSAFHMTMIVELEAMLRSWLGLRLAWMEAGRKETTPGFPTLAALNRRDAQRRWERSLLELASRHLPLSEELAACAEAARAARGKLQPLPFGAATSGVGDQAHCGLLQRADGRYFALLTLFPKGDPLGEPVQRAGNRRERGAVRNVRGGEDFQPTNRARASIMVPLELHHGHKTLFFDRAVPKSAEVVERAGDYYLHVAFEFPDHPARDMEDRLLLVRRGVGTLLAWTVMDAQRRVLEEGCISGKDLARLISEIRRVRAIRQRKGKLLRGDRRASRVTGHHLYSAGHQLRDVACRYGAQIILLEEPRDRRTERPNRWLAWRHFHRTAGILEQLCAEAGLPAPVERKLYTAELTCLQCGWRPGDPVRMEDPGAEQCAGCGTARDPEHHLTRLLGWSTLYYRQPKERQTGLVDYIRSHQV